MAQNSPIEWTDKTWNPVRGCSRISAGCGGPNHQGGCYAEKIAARFSGPGQAYEGLAVRTPHGGSWTGKVRLIESELTAPLTWRKPARIFVNSMSDLFHENLPDAAIDRVFEVMSCARHHIYQVLTKRGPRMQAYVTQLYKRAAVAGGPDVGGNPLPNVWLGVSVEDQAAAERIPHLLNTPAAVRFVSCEPLLGPLDLTEICNGHYFTDALAGLKYIPGKSERIPALDWVICGGESGPRKRPTDLAWHRSLRDQCKRADVAFFEKQIDKVIPVPTDLQVREFPKAAA